MQRRNAFGLMSLGASIAVLVWQKAWDWGWELFRAKVGEATYARVERTMESVSLKPEYIAAAFLAAFAVWLFWPTLRERFKRPDIEIALHPTLGWDGLRVDEDGRPVLDAMVFSVRLHNKRDASLSDCQVFVVLGDNAYAVSGRFDLRPDEPADVRVIWVHPEQVRDRRAFVYFMNRDGFISRTQASLLLPPGHYSIRVLAKDTRAVELPVELKASAPLTASVPREWTLEAVRS